jgi:hypothetical protein
MSGEPRRRVVLAEGRAVPATQQSAIIVTAFDARDCRAAERMTNVDGTDWIGEPSPESDPARIQLDDLDLAFDHASGDVHRCRRGGGAADEPGRS